MKKKTLLSCAAVLTAFFLLSSCATSPTSSTAGIPGVQSIDMARYLGRWYEISRIPVPIGRSCTRDS